MQILVRCPLTPICDSSLIPCLRPPGPFRALRDSSIASRPTFSGEGTSFSACRSWFRMGSGGSCAEKLKRAVGAGDIFP